MPPPTLTPLTHTWLYCVSCGILQVSGIHRDLPRPEMGSKHQHNHQKSPVEDLLCVLHGSNTVWFGLASKQDMQRLKQATKGYRKDLRHACRNEAKTGKLCMVLKVFKHHTLPKFSVMDGEWVIPLYSQEPHFLPHLVMYVCKCVWVYQRERERETDDWEKKVKNMHVCSTIQCK